MYKETLGDNKAMKIKKNKATTGYNQQVILFSIL